MDKNFFKRVSMFMGNVLNKIKRIEKKEQSGEGKKTESFAYNIFKAKQQEVRDLIGLIDEANERYKTSDGAIVYPKVVADVILSKICFLEEWKKNGVVSYDNSLDFEVKDIINGIETGEYDYIKQTVYVADDVKSLVKEMDTHIKSVQDKLPQESYIKNKAVACSEFINKIQEVLSNGELFATNIGSEKIVLSEKDSLTVSVYLKGLKNQINDLKQVYTYWMRALDKNDNEQLEKFANAYYLIDGFNLDMSNASFEALSYSEVVKGLWKRLMSYNEHIEALETKNIVAKNNAKGVFDRIEGVLKQARVEEKMPDSLREVDVILKLQDISQDEKLSEILHKESGMTEEDFDYVYALLDGKINEIISESYLGCAFRIDFGIMSQDYEKKHPRRIGCLSGEKKFYKNAVVNLSKTNILHIDQIEDFSRGAMANTAKLTTAQRQFAVMVETLVHECSHYVDEVLYSVGMRKNNPHEQQLHPLEQYVSFENFNTHDIILLAGLSPSLDKELGDRLSNEEQLQKFIDAVKFDKYYDLKAEKFARTTSSTVFNEIMATLSKEYEINGDLSNAHACDTFVKESDAITGRVLSVAEMTALDNAAEIVDNLLQDLKSMPNVDNLNKLCMDFNLTNLSNNDASEVERKAHGLAVKCFKNLSNEMQGHVVKESVRKGYFNLISVLKTHAGLNSSLEKAPSVEPLLDGLSVNDIVEYYRQLSKADSFNGLTENQRFEAFNLFYGKAEDPDRFKPVIQELFKDNNVAEVISFIGYENYNKGEASITDIASVDEMMDWLIKLDKSQIDYAHYPTLLNRLYNIVKSNCTDDLDKASRYLNYIDSENYRMLNTRAVVAFEP